MKKILSLLLAVAFLACVTVSPVSAQGRLSKNRTSRPLESTAIFTDQDGATMDYAVWIYGLTIFADDTTNCHLGIYDTATISEVQLGTAYARYEIGEPTQSQITTEQFTNPMYFATGVAGMVEVGGIGFVHYGPAPTD